MTLAEKVKSVEEIFRTLDTEINIFKEWSGLSCGFSCGKCCFKPDINATILEFLPLAYYTFKEGRGEALYEQAKALAEETCVILAPENVGGKCGNYTHRGLICRLFGYSARINKYNQADIITCRVIKTEQATPYQQAVMLVNVEEKSIPISSRYYMQLMAIDNELARTLYPVNVAIRKALETVMHYYAYRENEA